MEYIFWRGWYRAHWVKQQWRGCPHLGVHLRAPKGLCFVVLVEAFASCCKSQEIRSVVPWENQCDPKSQS